MTGTTIKTTEFSARMRERGIDLQGRRILLTQLKGSEQEKDLSEPANCNGFGRIRHFRFHSSEGWSDNPLPIFPALRAFGLGPTAEVRAQVFQNAVCNWRCWYCYVDFNRLSGDPRYSEFLSAAELVTLLHEANPDACMVDLSGGQPDLTPEWVPWIMLELRKRGLERQYYLWSDDNLSNDYFWRYLSHEERDVLRSYPMYGRVGCFKGFDDRSFTFNTNAPGTEFLQQFEIFSRLLAEGLDLYAYVTFTTPFSDELAERMSKFCDLLQGVHSNLPLRTVPLKVAPFTPVRGRMKEAHERAISLQQDAHAAWLDQLSRRFSQEERAASICDVAIR